MINIPDLYKIFIQNQPDMEKVWLRNACWLIQCCFVHKKIMFNLTLGDLIKIFRNLTNLHHNESTICFIFLKHRSKHMKEIDVFSSFCNISHAFKPKWTTKKKSYFENLIQQLKRNKRLTSRADRNFNHNLKDNNMKHMVYIIMICGFFSFFLVLEQMSHDFFLHETSICT